MKRLFILTTLLFVGFAAAMAQSMTDKEIIDFVIKEQKAGTSQEVVASQLLRKGVSVQRLQDIRKKYAAQINERGYDQVADKTISRLRNQEAVEKARKEAEERYSSQKKEYPLAVRNTPKAMSKDVGALMTVDSIIPDPNPVFGRDIFNKDVLTFEPSMNIATPSNYQLGAGDELIIDIYGVSQKTITAQVSPDGVAVIEGVGPVRVAGLTMTEANKRIANIVGARYASSQIAVSLGNTRSITVNVLGEVTAPGSYTLSGFATVFHALYSAGGINKIGTLRSVKVYRQSEMVGEVDVYDYMLNGNTKSNIRLEDGDVVMVGTFDGLVKVTGKVKRPMGYEMKSTETMEQLLQYAGGFTADAYKKSVRVVRNTGRDFTVFNLDEEARKSFLVADGDSVSVDSTLNRYSNMIEITGAVFRPGMYQLGENTNTVKKLLQMAEGVTEQAFAQHAVLNRLKPDRSLEAMSLNLEKILDGSAADVELRDNDRLFVPTRFENMQDRLVHIFGGVQFQGDYYYAEGMTIGDLILQAGGLTEKASIAKIDISRQKSTPDKLEAYDEIAETFTVDFLDGFAVGDKKDFVLMPNDVVYCRLDPNFIPQRQARIYGEITFPGIYTIPTRNARLSDLVKAAGGLTNFAYIEGARLTRRRTQEEWDQLRNTQRVVQLQENNEEVEETITNTSNYFVGIDLKKAIENPGSDADILIRDGDMIDVPPLSPTVKISGMVLYPNTVSYIEGKDVDYYIEQAGGYTERAKKRKTFIVNLNGTVRRATKANITPGCEILVPSKRERERMNISQWLGIGTSVASLATMVATFVNLSTK